MKQYQKIYDETCKIQVQQVKLGDVTYHARCKLAMLEEMLQDCENNLIEYKNRDNQVLIEWTQGKIEAYKLSIEMFKDLLKTYNRLPLSEVLPTVTIIK